MVDSGANCALTDPFNLFKNKFQPIFFFSLSFDRFELFQTRPLLPPSLIVSTFERGLSCRISMQTDLSSLALLRAQLKYADASLSA
jgi:hypothetical protein